MKTPYFLIDIDSLEQNLKVLRGVMDRTGCKILLAQKCFSCYTMYPLISKYLAGATASGIYEARLYRETMDEYVNRGVTNKHGLMLDHKVENHIFAPAFREEDIDEILRICDHIVFNSPRQLSLYGQRARDAGLQIGLRINPEHSTQEGHAIYDPCSPGSRLGTTLSQIEEFLNAGDEERRNANRKTFMLLDGLHFHTLCEQDSDDLESTLDAVVERFGKYLDGTALPECEPMKWINFGGGHHITREGYDIPRLERCINRMTDMGLQVYLEPGEAVALNAGTLHSSVLEVQPADADGIQNVILDTSAACHMPDVIEMPYTPPLVLPKVVDEDMADEQSVSVSQGSHTSHHTYRFGGPTCLSGDVIGTYNIEQELKEGDEVVFGDMAIYSMVKTNTFNGMPLPDIYLKLDHHGENVVLWKSFTFEDFKSRL